MKGSIPAIEPAMNQNDSQTRSPRWSPALIAAAVALAALFLSMSLRAIWSADLFWQLRAGQWILEHGWPATDALSYTVPANEWIELRWIHCILSYGLWNVGGAPLLIAMQTVMLGGTLALYVLHSKRAAVTLPGLVAVGLCVVALHQRYVVRPELFTYLLTAVFVVVMDNASRGRHRRLLWMLPVLQVLWVNAHTLFVFGPIVAGAFLGADTLRRCWQRLTGPDDAATGRVRRGSPAARRTPPAWIDRSLAGVAALVTLACLVNPWGLRGALFPLILFRQIRQDHPLARTIEEFTSPFFTGSWTPDYTFGVALAALGAATFILNWRRTDLARLALWAAHIYLAVTASRNLALFAFIGLWAVLRNVEDLLEHDATPSPVRRLVRRLGPVPTWAVGVAAIVGAWAMVAERWMPPNAEPRSLNLGVYRSTMPEAPVRFLMELGASPQLFHGMRDAGYLTWAAHERYPVFVDGRLEVYTAAFIEQYLLFLSEDWDRFVERHGINVVLVNREDLAVLASRLAARTDWVLVYLDDMHTIWVRDIPEHAALIAQHQIDRAAPWTPRADEPSETLAGWRRAIGARARPWFSTGMVRQFMALGVPDNALPYLERAIKVRPDDRNARMMLAQFELYRGNTARADELLSGIRWTAAERAGGDRTLGDLLLNAGRDAEAAAPLERAIIGFPDDWALWARLARARNATGDHAAAIRAYREAIRRAPGVVEYHINMGILLQQSGDARTALRAYSEAARLDPRRPELWTQMGLIYAAIGDATSARQCFQNALSLRPDDARALQGLADLSPRR